MTGKDLNYQSSTAEPAKFDYSPLSRFFNMELKEEEKKEGLLRRLRSIKEEGGKNLTTIKDQKEEKKLNSSKKTFEL